MDLAQMARIRHWLRLHGARHPAELWIWDLICIAWVAAWLAIPLSVILGRDELMPLSLLALVLPALYVAWRSRLHRRGKLRCDWLTAL
ncbi:MAG: hypothetical protein JO006_07305 [Paucibacter sp.]|nr:hypothetical protein [Roseateles sp.]